MTKTSPTGASIGGKLRRLAASRWLRAGVVTIAVTLGILALVSQWSEIEQDLDRLTLWAIAGAFLSVVAALAATVAAFRTILADLGSHLRYSEAYRVLIVGQLGKYIPGSVWGVLGPGELALRHAVPRSRSAVTMLLTLAFCVSSGVLLAAATLPFAASGLARDYAVLLLLAPLVVGVMHPKIVNAGLAWLLRMARRPPMERPLSWRGILRAFLWTVASWVMYGVAVGSITASLGVDPVKGVVVGIGAFALAWTAGFLFVIAPAGAGVREAVLVAGLAPILDTSTALFVALVDRAVVTLGELACAACAALVVRSRRSAGSPPA